MWTSRAQQSQPHPRRTALDLRPNGAARLPCSRMPRRNGVETATRTHRSRTASPHEIEARGLSMEPNKAQSKSSSTLFSLLSLLISLGHAFVHWRIPPMGRQRICHSRRARMESSGARLAVATASDPSVAAALTSCQQQLYDPMPTEKDRGSGLWNATEAQNRHVRRGMHPAHNTGLLHQRVAAKRLVRSTGAMNRSESASPQCLVRLATNRLASS